MSAKSLGFIGPEFCKGTEKPITSPLQEARHLAQFPENISILLSTVRVYTLFFPEQTQQLVLTRYLVYRCPYQKHCFFIFLVGQKYTIRFVQLNKN